MEADRAREKLNGTIVEGRKIEVREGFLLGPQIGVHLLHALFILCSLFR